MAATLIVRLPSRQPAYATPQRATGTHPSEHTTDNTRAQGRLRRLRHSSFRQHVFGYARTVDASRLRVFDTFFRGEPAVNASRGPCTKRATARHPSADDRPVSTSPYIARTLCGALLP
jgi:hypothetical protein